MTASEGEVRGGGVDHGYHILKKTSYYNIRNAPDQFGYRTETIKKYNLEIEVLLPTYKHKLIKTFTLNYLKPCSLRVLIQADVPR